MSITLIMLLTLANAFLLRALQILYYTNFDRSDHQVTNFYIYIYLYKRMYVYVLYVFLHCSSDRH